MTKVVFLASVAFATVLLCEGMNSAQHSNASATLWRSASSSLKAPDADWEASFFKALEKRTKKLNLPSLRDAHLGKRDIELRFWYDARPDTINGFIIRRLGDQWSAMGVHQVNDRWPSPVKRSALRQPQSGWDSLWKRLVDSGLLTLTDSREGKCRPGVLDGLGYVVETKVSGKYRAYRYANPQLAECDEAKQVLAIESIIADEFQLDAARN